MRSRLEAYWDYIPSKYKRWVVVGVVAAAILGAIYMFVSSSPETKTRQRQPQQRNIFGTKDFETRFGLSGVGSELDQLQMENKKLKDQFNRLTAEKQALPQIAILKKQLEDLQKKMENFQKLPAVKPEAKAESTKVEQGPVSDVSSRGIMEPRGQKTGETAKSTSPGSGLPFDKAGFQSGAGPAREIKVITASQPAETKVQKAKKDTVPGTFLPSGSIFSGTLITGLDVTCGSSAKKDPFPVLLRVKKEAILPNRYTADVQECFLIAAGWGDMSSERAYLRGERLSCIREDGKALETKIDMYAVGEDGKAGVRGRLVSKTGALLAKALMAGFMEGFSRLFSSQPITLLGTGTYERGTTTPFQQNFSKQALQGAGIEGLGSALDRLSNYYIDMAQNIFPVIEVDAGRSVDFVLITGKSLQLEGKN